MDRIIKEVTEIFKEIDLKTEIKTSLKVINFLDIIFNLSNGTYKPYRKPSDNLLNVNTSLTICLKLLSSYQHQQQKDFPKKMVKKGIMGMKVLV